MRRLVIVSVMAVMAVLAGSATGARFAGTIPRQLVGTWKRNVTASDVVRLQAAIPPGIWIFKITAAGWGTVRGGEQTVAGPITSASSNTLRIGITDALVAHPVGLYRWALSGGRLTLSRIRDPFAERASVLWGVWTRK